MNTRFTLPVAFAVAVHATLLFGFRHAAATPGTKPLKDKPKPADFVIKIEPETITENNDPGPKGPSNFERPTLPDEVRSLSPLDIPILVSMDAPRVPIDLKPFSGEIPGREDGVPEGVKITGGIISSGLLDNPPNARVQASPDYPFAARTAGLSGEVTVEFVVDETGRVVNPMVVHSSDRIFEEPSLRAVLKWRFEPGRRDGRVVRFRMAVPVVFNLGSE